MIGQSINLSFNLETIYKDCHFCINDKDKVGIIGVNGAGKTTLFRVILKEIPLDSGKIILNNKTIGYLPQEINIEDQNIITLDYLLSARPIKQLEQDLQNQYQIAATTTGKDQEKALKQISKINDQLEYYEVYSCENILLSLIDNMHINPALLDMPLKSLSGGEKSKMAFIHLLYSKKEILLLDEPTNHIDKTTKEFITDYLRSYSGTILIISHDTEFLNRVINKIMYIDKANNSITMYNGNYDTYLKKSAQSKELKERLVEKQEKELKQLHYFITKADNASRTNHNLKRMGKDRKQKLEHLENQLITRDKTYSKIKLNIKPNHEGSKIPIKVNNISYNYSNKQELYTNLSFIINKKERFLILGHNGVGKSTLLKLITGIIKPTKGTITYGNNTDIAYYAQELELLNPNKNILENIDKQEYSEKELRTILGKFLFKGDDVFKKVNVLSPGEKARICLCKIMLEKANLLILDEPTNHLDPDTQKIIGENFKSYEGTIIIVSHNQSFIEGIGIDRILILPNGKITNYSKEIVANYKQVA